MRKWLAVVLMGTIFASGCMGGGQQQPQSAPEPSGEQVEKSVKKALHDEDMKDFLRTQVRTQAGIEMLEMALDTQEGQKALQEAVKRTLSTSVGQQAIANKLGEMLNDPAFKTQIQMAIKETLTEVLAKGAEKKEKKEGGTGKEQQKEGGS